MMVMLFSNLSFSQSRTNFFAGPLILMKYDNSILG